MSLRLLLVLLPLLPFLAGSGMAQYATPKEPQAMIIRGVAITGNRITKEHIIMRELVVQEGDTVAADLFYGKLERSRQNLVNTGLFNTVSVLPLYIDKQQVIIEVTVGERWYLWPSPIFELADPNFNTWWLTKDLSRINYGLYLTRFNFRGRNETVYLLAQFGYTKQFAMRYKVPFFDKQQRWGLSVGGSLLEQSEVTAGTLDNDRILVANPSGPNRQERMADVQLDLRRRHDVRHNWRLGFVQAEVTDTITTIAPDYFDGAAQATRFLTFGYSLTWDRRDVRFFPREGHLAEFRADRFGLGLLDRSSPDITTLQASGKRWWRMSEKVTLALSMRGKYTFGTPPYYVQEGLGYRHYVRGYEYYVIDGEHFVLGKTNFILQLVAPREYRVESIPMEAFRTLYFALYLNLYADVGRVWDGRYAATNFLANEWMSGYGVGLDLVSSYDQVVRAEYSLNALGQHGFFLHFTQPF
jgi:outer membrane protein assembly factor BamA